MVELLRALQAAGNVAGIAVEEEERAPRRLGPAARRDPPPVELFPIVGVDADGLVLHPRPIGRDENRRRWLKEQLTLECERQGHEGEVAGGDDEKRGDHGSGHRKRSTFEMESSELKRRTLDRTYGSRSPGAARRR